ncbi:CRISPR-associated helicase/endonuclease Cas3 [Acrocarpospora phusangensis]|uniref:CRISPR-associated helicase/endonuclease Cas3 n=1 Tax=Acrocarpospora phusangensis TaxID=1070424 RepID=A0A919QKW8_9ACTN|nr:CRISPR-associated helicase Cas3' [Acrocarpospora phusangensis]GIH29593.1 CRISPR-associated helicase/endonuclease Cas3 [Acrocarpospora phusangensis]
MAEPNVDLDLWGKSRGLPLPYPLVCHLLDTAAMAETLWDEYLSVGLRVAVATELNSDQNETRSLLSYWAALHDIGKCTPGFQGQIKSGLDRLAGYDVVTATPQRHDYAGHVWLGQMLLAAGYKMARKNAPAFRVAQMLGGHHGRFAPFNGHEFKDPIGSLPALGKGKWEEQRQGIASLMHRLTGAPRPPVGVSAAGGALACGLVILADWLASQEGFLLAQLQAGIPETCDADSLMAHLVRSRAAAPGLLRDAGLGRVRFAAGGFRDDFPFEPNDLQRSVSEELPALVSEEPGLLLITAPMGEGKTEAALHAGRLMGEAAGMPGYFIGLPTMATSDQMLQRVDEFRGRRIQGADSLTLLHGMAWLNTAYTAEGREVGVLTGDPMATRWLRGSKRGLLANLAVGTVDQALLSVLRGRHNVLRMLGLAGKVLVIDEVHAYDAYMQGLLKVLLEWLGSLRVPVVLLSATLPVGTGQRLAQTYLAGAGCEGVEAPRVAYPGWLYVSPRGTKSVTVLSRERKLHVETRNVLIGPDKSPDRAPVLRDVLEPLVRDGGCAAVICNTVGDAQRTYLALRAWLGERSGAVPVVRLLHSRFPAHRREEITQEAVSWFGKQAGGARPTAAILVATQVIEQSLDLDFDLVVSDLAPIAMLLQRAGRCQRHVMFDRWRRSWAMDVREAGTAGRMRLVVLIPVDMTGDLRIPIAWPFVYPTALLRRTRTALANLPGGQVRIPGEIQHLVDQVYDETFGDETSPITDEDLARLADDQTKDMYAQMAAIPAPRNVDDLSQFTGDDFVTEYSTRLGADSARVVCCTRGADGRLTLGEQPLPTEPNGRKGDRRWFTKEQVRHVLTNVIPVPGTWSRGHSASDAAPAGWQDSPHLRDLVVVEMPDQRSPGMLGEREVWLTPELGLSDFMPSAHDQAPRASAG